MGLFHVKLSHWRARPSSGARKLLCLNQFNQAAELPVDLAELECGEFARLGIARAYFGRPW